MTTPPALHWADALGHEVSDKRIDILRRIALAGSISEAARGAGVSYKAAWQALDTLGNLAGAPLLERTVGGAGGGGARLTAAGHELLRVADGLAQARAEALARLAGATRTGAAALGLRTSMRNQIPCSVLRVQGSGGAVRVTLRMPGSGEIASRITRESAQLLGLRAGLEVLALFKATAVRVGPGPVPGPEANRLEGVLSRVSRAAGGGEAALTLPGGQSVVGFVAPGSGLQPRAAVTAWVEMSAVAVALPG